MFLHVHMQFSNRPKWYNLTIFMLDENMQVCGVLYPLSIGLIAIEKQRCRRESKEGVALNFILFYILLVEILNFIQSFKKHGLIKCSSPDFVNCFLPFILKWQNLKEFKDARIFNFLIDFQMF